MQLSKGRIIAIVLAVGLALIAIFKFGFYDRAQAPTEETSVESNSPVVSTDPSPLEGATLLPNQPIKITFDKKLESSGEFWHTFEPELEHDVQLANDNYTVVLIPRKGYPAGASFTLTIHPKTRILGGGTLDVEKQYHIQTVKYSGI